jgi:hypothetical protein
MSISSNHYKERSFAIVLTIRQPPSSPGSSWSELAGEPLKGPIPETTRFGLDAPDRDLCLQHGHHQIVPSPPVIEA